MRAPIPAMVAATKVIEPLHPDVVAAIALVHARTQCFDLTVAGARLGVSRSTIYNLVNAGELASVEVGQKRRVVTLAALDDYISRHPVLEVRSPDAA